MHHIFLLTQHYLFYMLWHANRQRDRKNLIQLVCHTSWKGIKKRPFCCFLLHSLLFFFHDFRYYSLLLRWTSLQSSYTCPTFPDYSIMICLIWRSSPFLSKASMLQRNKCNIINMIPTLSQSSAHSLLLCLILSVFTMIPHLSNWWPEVLTCTDVSYWWYSYFLTNA